MIRIDDWQRDFDRYYRPRRRVAVWVILAWLGLIALCLGFWAGVFFFGNELISQTFEKPRHYHAQVHAAVSLDPARPSLEVRP